MTPEEQQAEALARWLDGPRRSPPPSIDPGVIEAVGCLQPDRAPPLELTADDILASVRGGPLAQPEPQVARAPSGVRGAALSGEDPAHDSPSDVAPDVSMPAANNPLTPNRTPWLRWAIGGGTATLLAAALALLVLVPTLSSDRMPLSARQDEAAAPEGGPGRGATSSSEAREAAPVEPSELAAGPAPKSVAIDGDREARGGGYAPSTAASRPARPAAAPSPDASAASSEGERMAANGVTSRSAAPSRTAAAPRASIEESDDAIDAVADSFPMEEMEEVAEAEPSNAGRTDRDQAYEQLDGALAADDAAMAPAEPEAEPEEVMAASDAPRRQRRASRAESSTSAKDASAPASQAPDLEPTARPTGTPTAAAAALNTQLDAGEVQQTLSDTQEQLARPGLGTTERADLLWVRGKALRAANRPNDADQAFLEAIRLRQR